MSLKYYILIICFVNFAFCDEVKEIKENDDFGMLSSMEDRMESKFGEYAAYMTDWLKKFNDKHLIKSDLGRMLHYEDIQPKAKGAGNEVEGRSAKRMAAIIPLIFHIGMAAAWMLMTTILSAKSVAIGMTLLVLKIAVGSAKLASYFTAWKAKTHHGHHDHGWIPHHEHHGEDRSFNDIDHHATHEWPSYSPEWIPHETSSSSLGTEYKLSSPYQGHTFGEYEFPVDPKKTLEKKYG